MTDFDVAVVGGGPAGSTVAALCAQRGLRVALLEHCRFPRAKVCGEVLNPHCWPTFQRLGVADAVRSLPLQCLSGACFTASNGQCVAIDTARSW